jgi:hypothetical protein
MVLCDSHIVPKWSYKRMRHNSFKNKNPMFIRSGKAIQTSDQVREYLLCSACEQHIGKFDSWASHVLYQADHTAPILNRAHRAPERWLVLTEGDAAMLSRFCLSVFWRAHASSRLDTSLGNYGDAVRKYLLDDHLLPSEISLVTCFYECKPGGGSQIDALATLPTSSRNTGFYQHRFVLFGLDAILAVGKLVPPVYKRYCLIQSMPRRLILEDSDQVIEWMAKPFAEAMVWRQRRGYVDD